MTLVWRLREFCTDAIETGRWLEPVAGVVGGAVGWRLSGAITLNVPEHPTLYAAMTATSLALMTVTAIAVNLAAALTSSEQFATLALKARQFATASFTSLGAFLVGAAIGLLLLAIGQSCGRPGRYVLAGVWVGLTVAASLRGLALGRKVLEVSIRSKGAHDG
jgi:hypothetical protein